MPTTKKKPVPPSETERPTPSNGAASEVFTLAEAAGYLRVSEADVLDLICEQNLPGRSIGTEWRFLKAAVEQWLATGSPSRQARKDAQLALAGKYQDDPDLMRICEEAYRQRAHSMTERE